MNKLTVIIAGNINEARYYAREHGLSKDDFRYVDHWSKIAGLIDFNVVFTGRYYLNPMDSQRGRDELEIRSKMKK